jgi:D-alanyl-D-alanine carboxypeptidase
MMNQKAKDLNLDDTGFYNSSGLDIVGGQANYSTAADLAVLVKYMLENHQEIFAMTMQPGPCLTENGIFSFKLWDGQKLVGGKTGYTEKAGGCMIAVFKNESGRRYINILLGAASAEARVEQMQKMVNYANNAGN